MSIKPCFHGSKPRVKYQDWNILFYGLGVRVLIFGDAVLTRENRVLDILHMKSNMIKQTYDA